MTAVAKPAAFAEESAAEALVAVAAALPRCLSAATVTVTVTVMAAAMRTTEASEAPEALPAH